MSKIIPTEAESVIHDADTIGRFWVKVDRSPGHGPNGDCWLWLAGKSQGYGRFAEGRRMRPATQIAWEIENSKPFPAAMFACHSCDNPACVRPSHIWPGTNADNLKDAGAKGRLYMQRLDHKLFGSAHGASKLTEREIPLIREMHKNGFGSRTIAKAFSISRFSIRRILSGEGWTHV